MLRHLAIAALALYTRSAQAVTLAGSVSDPDGHPAAAASVLVNPYSATNTPSLTVQTNAAGQFAVDVALAEGAAVACYATWHGLVAVAGWSPGEPPVDLSLRPARHDDGLVFDGQGQPVAGAVVRPLYVSVASPHSPRLLIWLGPDVPSVRTDAQGRWQAALVPMDCGRVDYEISAPGYPTGRVQHGDGGEMAPQTIVTLQPPPEPRPPVNGGKTAQAGGRDATVRTAPERRPPPEVTVQIADTAGQALPGVEVLVDSRQRATCYRMTDAAGRIVLPAQPDEQLTIATLHPWRLATTRLTAPNVTVRLQPQPATTLNGRVVDSNAGPVKGLTVTLLPTTAPKLEGAARIELPPSTTRSDGDGRYHFDDVPVDCKVQIELQAPGRWSALNATATDTAVLPNLVAASGRIAGHVVDAAGQPVAGARVFVEGACDPTAAHSAADGSFVLEHVPAQATRLVALSGRFALGRGTAGAGSTAVRIVVREQRPTPWPDQPSADDLSQAAELSAQALEGIGDRPELLVAMDVLARCDWPRAVEVALTTEPGQRDVRIMLLAVSASPGMAADTAEALLHATRSDLYRAFVAYGLSRVDAERDAMQRYSLRDAVRRAHHALRADDRADRLALDAMTLGVALHLRQPEAKPLTAALLALAPADLKELTRALESLSDFGPTDTVLLEALLPAIGTGSPPAAKLVAELARHDPHAALERVRAWWLKGQVTLTDEAQRQAVATVAGELLAAGDLAAAATLGPYLDEAGQRRAASRAPDAAGLRGLLHLAPQDDLAKPFGSRPAALLLEPLDAAAAEASHLRGRSATLILNDERYRLAEAGPGSSVSRAYTMAHADPNRARWALECLVAQLPEAVVTPDTASRLTVAMAAVDPARAVWLAQHLGGEPCHAVAMAQLARWLAAPGWNKRTW